MYCTACGREISDLDAFCPACGKENLSIGIIPKADPEPSAPTYTEEQRSKDRRCGLGRAITGAVLAIVSVILSYIGFVVGVILCMEFDDALGIMFFFLAIAVAVALCIVAIVFGARSIGTFIRLSREGRAKPIATLIIGIDSLVSGVVSLFASIVYVLLELLIIWFGTVG